MTVWLIHFVEPVEGAKTPTGAPAVTFSSTSRLLIAGDEIKGQCLWLWDIFPVVTQDADNSLNTLIMLELRSEVVGHRWLLALTWQNALERYEPITVTSASTDFVWNKLLSHWLHQTWRFHTVCLPEDHATALDIYPLFVPKDQHVLLRRGGGYAN